MTKQLVIVESPAKAKTIERYLGKDYEVRSSFGHIRDLPKKGLSIDIKHDFKPTYEIPPDKQKVVNDLKKAAKTAKDVLLASDEDREGEAIAWHLCQALNLKPSSTKRIVFHEITEPAINYAIGHPRHIDINLVDAQQARRILDRLVGYELSPVLWKKVRPGLSAGRVQSVAVRLIVEREREIKSFKADANYKVTGIFKAGRSELPSELNKRLSSEVVAKKFLEDCSKSDFKITSIDKKPSRRSSGAPFTTSTLQQEAARQLGYSVKQTMTLAQRLYENGHITYMRTDSTTLSDQALKQAETYIIKEYGAKYYQRKQYKTNKLGAQEAHEAIRPTHFNKESVNEDDSTNKLYKLIWRRTLASQMSDAETEKTEVAIAISKRSELFMAKGEIITFAGYLRVYGGGKEDVILPDLSLGQKLDAKSIMARQTYSKPPARYSEASLVRKLEELGIGRPSTYVPTISTIQTRGYIEKTDVEGLDRTVKVLTLEKGKVSEIEEAEKYGSDRSKLIPTPLADVTTDFLTKYFANIVDYDFTAKAETSLDAIAEGKEKWDEVLEKFYKGFHPLIDKSEKISRKESTQTRKVGTDPSTKKPIFARFGRYGPMLQRGEAEDEEKPTFAPLPANSTIEDVTLDQALEMFKLPRVVGETKDGKVIEANIGPYGPYVKVEKLYISIGELDPLKISEDEARNLYVEKQKMVEHKYIQEFKGGVKIANGPYGPYVTNGKRNVSIPKDQNPKSITEDEAKKLLSQPPNRKAPRRKKK